LIAGSLLVTRIFKTWASDYNYQRLINLAAVGWPSTKPIDMKGAVGIQSLGK